MSTLTIPAGWNIEYNLNDGLKKFGKKVATVVMP